MTFCLHSVSMNYIEHVKQCNSFVIYLTITRSFMCLIYWIWTDLCIL